MKRTAVGVTIVALVLAGAFAAASTAAVKLPKKLTSPTGNFFTLYAFDQPTSSDPLASAEIQVCASSHTPEPDTYLDPQLFTVKLSSGATANVSKKAAHSPTLAEQHLNPNQCSTKGWMSFAVPKGQHVSILVYDFNGKISWDVG